MSSDLEKSSLDWSQLTLGHLSVLGVDSFRFGGALDVAVHREVGLAHGRSLRLEVSIFDDDRTFDARPETVVAVIKTSGISVSGKSRVARDPKEALLVVILDSFP